MTNADAPPRQRRGRLRLVRDAAVFQLKLFVDGFRDLVLSPISILTAALDVLTGSDRFYRLLHLGRRSERWINLFGSHEQAGLDDAVARVEQLVAEQYRKGNLTATARDSLDRTLDHLRAARRPAGVTERESQSGDTHPDP